MHIVKSVYLFLTLLSVVKILLQVTKAFKYLKKIMNMRFSPTL